MSDLLTPSSCLLFSSVLFNKKHLTNENVKTLIENYFDRSDEFFPLFNPLLKYYSKEMGDERNLVRVIYYNHRQYQRDELIKAKLWADRVEKENLLEGKQRKVNIDVGMLVKEQMILATGKPYAHRIYLSDGVYADLNYIFANKSYQKLDWTYPDYAHQEKINFFNWLRQGLF